MRASLVLLLISLIACLSVNHAQTKSNGMFWNVKDDSDSFLGLPSKADIGLLNIVIIKQSTEFIYLMVKGELTAKLSESSLRQKFRKFAADLEIYEDDLLLDNLIGKEKIKINLPFKEKTGNLVKFSSYSGKFSYKVKVKVADIKAHLGPMDKPKLFVKLIVHERTSKATKNSNSIDVDLNPQRKPTSRNQYINSEQSPSDAFDLDLK